jgi:catenin beta 1
MIKPAIIAAGGMEALARHLNSNHSKITYQCIWTMRNLSDVATDIQDPGKIKLVPDEESHNSNLFSFDLGALAFQLVKLLSHPEKPIIVCAAGIISNLVKPWMMLFIKYFLIELTNNLIFCRLSSVKF